MEKNDILMIQGQDYRDMTVKLLERAHLDKLIGSTGSKIGIKPNLVLPSPASKGATTHPQLIEGLLQYLQSKNFHNIQVMESSWYGASTEESLKVCGYQKILDKYNVPFLDMKKQKSREYDCAGLKLNICEAAVDVDYMINVPVLKGHCQTQITCALKNNKGLIPDRKKSRSHMTGRVKKLAGYAAPVDACSACYGSLIYALDRLYDRKMLSDRLPPVAIGQGYRGKTGKIGVGNCTRCFEKNLKGCPPKAVEIAEFLEREWNETITEYGGKDNESGR